MQTLGACRRHSLQLIRDLCRRLFVFALVFVTVMYPINVGLPKLIFAGADSLSGHVARVVIELSRLLFARLLLVLILFVGHGMLLLTSLRLPCASLTPRGFCSSFLSYRAGPGAGPAHSGSVEFVLLRH
jgi:hypothetical protein